MPDEWTNEKRGKKIERLGECARRGRAMTSGKRLQAREIRNKLKPKNDDGKKMKHAKKLALRVK